MPIRTVLSITAVLHEARAEVQRRLHAGVGARVAPTPAPRYDDVFFEGTAQLARDAGADVGASPSIRRTDTN